MPASPPIRVSTCGNSAPRYRVAVDDCAAAIARAASGGASMYCFFKDFVGLLINDAGKLLSYALLIATLTTPCEAQQQMVTVWIYGYGNKTCGDFVAASENIRIGTRMTTKPYNYISENCLFKQFAFGYITGVNHAKADMSIGKPIENLSESTLDLWLRNYCNSHPLSKFFDAMLQFVAESVSHSTH